MDEVVEETGSRNKFALVQEYRQELFARGYVVSKQSVWAPDGWRSTTFADFNVAHDPRLQAHAGAGLLVLGLIYDVRDAGRTALDCVALLSSELARSTAEFVDMLSFMSGRYVILFQADAATHLLADATGMKAAFYGGGFVASHIRLAAVQFDAREIPRGVGAFGFPGLRTPFEGVRILTPNARLNLHTMAASRYWPTQPVARRSMEECVGQLSTWLRASAEHLAEHRPLLSLTAGVDSRTTLAAFRGLPFKSFTYRLSEGNPNNPHDVPTTQALKERLGFDHLMLEGSTALISPEFDQVLGLNLVRRHTVQMSHFYYTTFHSGDYLHVRSNLGEVGRRFYKAERRGDPLETPEQLQRHWLKGKVVDDPEMLTAFREFAEVTGILNTPMSPYTLFYWEHRMGGWHGQVAAESDPAFDSVSIFNCRAILCTLLAVSDAEQESAELFLRTIERLWPELAEFPINGHAFRPAPAAVAARRLRQRVEAAATTAAPATTSRRLWLGKAVRSVRALVRPLRRALKRAVSRR